MVRTFGRPQLAKHGKDLNPLAVSPVVSGSGGRPRRRPAQVGVPMMGLLRKGVQAIVVGVHERGAKRRLLIHEPGLGQRPHCQGRMGLLKVCSGGAHVLVEVWSSGMHPVLLIHWHVFKPWGGGGGAYTTPDQPILVQPNQKFSSAPSAPVISY